MGECVCVYERHAHGEGAEEEYVTGHPQFMLIVSELQPAYAVECIHVYSAFLRDGIACEHVAERVFTMSAACVSGAIQRTQ